MAELPAFKPSGQGGSIDLKNIYTSQAIGWGAYKGGLVKRFKDNGGVAYLDGMQVFLDTDISYGVQDPGSDVYDMLEFMGFTSEDIAEINEVQQDSKNNVEKIILDYIPVQGYDKDAFEFVMNALLDKAQDFDYITIKTRNNMYKPGYGPISEIGPRQMGMQYNLVSEELERQRDVCENNEVECDDPTPIYWMYYPPPTNPFIPSYGIVPEYTILNPHRLLENVQVTMWKDGRDISSQFIDAEKNILAVLSMIETSMISSSNRRTYEIDRLVAYYIEQDEDRPLLVTEYWKELIVEERYTFDNILRQTITNDDRYKWFAKSCSDLGVCDDDMTDEEKDTKYVTVNFCSYLWLAQSNLLWQDSLETTEGLFYLWKGPSKTILVNGELSYIYPDAKMFMTVDGLKKSTQGIFGYYMSRFLHIDFVQEEPSFIAKFVGGLISAFLNIIDALTGLSLKIPVLKQMTEMLLKVIGSLFNVDGATAREILNKVILAIVIIVIGYFLGPAISAAWNSVSTALTTTTAATTTTALGTGVEAYIAANASVGMGATFNTLATYSMNALTVFNAAQEGRATGEAKKYAQEKANRDYRNRKAQEESLKSEALLGGTMGGVEAYGGMNDGMYNVMFNPFYFFPQAIPPEELNNGYLF